MRGFPFARLCVALLTLLVAPGIAAARSISIDFGDGNFPSSGNNFTLANTTELDRAGDAGGTAVDIGFVLNFGTGTTYSSLFVSENGIVSFGSALGAFTSVASLDALGAPVIATYYADLVSTGPSGDPLALTAGTITASTGVADPTADSLGGYSTSETVQAFRLTWLGGALASDPNTQVYTQLLLYAAGAAGDFDMRIAYGFFSDTPIQANGALAGFSLGANATSIAGPFQPTTDYFYSFRNGALVNGGGGEPAPVPEPATGALLLLGLASTAFARRRRCG